MKILLITGSLPPLKCGIGFYSEKLLFQLTKRVEVNILTTQDYNASLRIPTNHIKNWKISSLFNIYKLCKGSNADCYSLQYPARGYKKDLGINILPYLIRYIMMKPVVVTLHEYHGSGILGRTRNFVTSLPASKIVVSNQYDLISLPKILRKKAMIIPIGSNIELAPENTTVFDNIIRSSGFSAKKRTGVFFGFAFPNKGLDLLLDVVEIMKSQLILITDLNERDAYQSKLLKRIREIKANGGKVHHTGFLDNIKSSQILRECDYFVLPQPLPLTGKSGTAIAAVMHSLPIISTGSPSPELNLPYINNENSILLEKMDFKNLKEALIKLEQNSEMLSKVRMGEKLLIPYFDWSSIANKHHKLYEDIIGE